MEPVSASPAEGRRWSWSRLRWWALRVLVFLVVAPVVQVLLVRWVTPPITMTMVGTGWARGEWPETSSVTVPWDGPIGRAVIGSEDGWFFLHNGFDPGAIAEVLQARAEGRSSRGASTLSQQVARNAFLWQGRSWLRKGLEAGYTVLLELLVPKERILELYLQIAQTGPNTFGFEAGAQRWFGKPAAALSKEEAARLVAVLPAPSTWNPRGEYAGGRAAVILGQLVPYPGEPGFEQVRKAAEARMDWAQVWEAVQR
jgi:monofunctional biosynthetic peptidoglycan transglycosylase